VGNHERSTNNQPTEVRQALGKRAAYVIRTEAENNRMLGLVEELMAKGASLTPEEGELLMLLGKLISDFEEGFITLISFPVLPQWRWPS
jgi:hypothetical protein